MQKYILMLILLVCVPLTEAQDEARGNGWEIIERCISEPLAPPDDWSFDGYIAFYNEDGIHAIRSDLETPYYLAFTNPGQFTNIASFSPDGKWLLVPSGFSGADGWNRRVSISELRIFSTGLDRQLVYRIPWQYSFPLSSHMVSINEWETTDYFEFQQGNYFASDLWHGITIAEDRQYQVVKIEKTFEMTTFDNQLVIMGESETGESGISYTYEINNGHILPDRYWYLNEFYYRQYIAIQQNGDSAEQVTSPDIFENIHNFAISPDGKFLAFRAAKYISDESEQPGLFIIDIESKQIINICLDSFNIFWSPDGTHFVLADSEGNDALSVVHFGSMDNYRLAYQFSGDIVGWYP